MKKLLLEGGGMFVRVSTILAVVGLLCVFSPSSHAQGTSFTLQFNGLPSGDAGVNPADYIGLDRKLKSNVAGQTLTITAVPALKTPRQVRLTIVVSGSGLSSTLPNCNRTIATATTVAFPISGGGRTLASSDFTGSGIGIQTSDTYQPCIDDISDKITKGAVALPNGIYSISATLNDAASGAQLASTSQPITITAGSVVEAQINLTSPANDAQIMQTPSVTFDFNTSISGELLVFEHNSLGQSPQDATSNDSSPLKVFEGPVIVSGPSSPQVVVTSPGNALRPFSAGKKYSWYFRGSVPSSSGSPEIKESPIWSFIVLSSDPNYTRLVNSLQSAPDPVGTTFANLINSGYLLNLNGTFFIQSGDNGAPQTQTVDQILALLASLAQKNVQLKVSVVSQ